MKPKNEKYFTQFLELITRRWFGIQQKKGMLMAKAISFFFIVNRQVVKIACFSHLSIPSIIPKSYPIHP